MSIFDGLRDALTGSTRRKNVAALLQELDPLPHPERTQRMVALGQAAKTDAKARELLDALWNSEGDSAAYARRLVLKSCYGSHDGARVLQALSDASRLLRGGARKLVALCCDDAQATQALQTTWYVRQHLPLLQALRGRGRCQPIDAFLDWLAVQPGDTRLADCVPYGSDAAIERHLAAALHRPSVVFWDGLLARAPQILGRYLHEELRRGTGKPDSTLLWVTQRSLPRLCLREPTLALNVFDGLLARGVPPDSGLWTVVARRKPALAADIAVRHKALLPAGSFEAVARDLPVDPLCALLRHNPFALGTPQKWFRFLPEAARPQVIAAWLDTIAQHPSWGAALLRQLAADPILGTPQTLDAAYARWSPAAQNADGVIGMDVVSRLPPQLAEREGRRHLTQVTALLTRPRQRLPYARFLPWDEAQAQLKPYVGHPEGEVRGQAVAVLLSLAGHTRDAERRSALTVEALRMVKARKNEQDPVRLALLQALVGWPRVAWQANHLPDVAQILRDALDAADLSHATAQVAEQLVVRLFRIDGAWGGKWLATLIKERGTIYAPRLGDQLTDGEVRAVAPHLLEVAKSWASREREAHLVALVSSLAARLSLVPGLLDLVQDVLRRTPHAATALALMTLLGQHERSRFLALADEVCAAWSSRKWDSALVSLAQSLKRGEIPAGLVTALDQALDRCVYAHQASSILTVLAQRAAPDFRRIVPLAIRRDQSFVCVPAVYEHLHKRRQDLLGPCLGSEPIRGRFATGKTRWLLPFTGGFFRWTPGQQTLFAAQIDLITADVDRDTPTVFWALVRLPELQFIAPKALVALADDKRPAVLEKAVRTLGRCDAGQGVDKLLACLEDSRARYAIYALRRAVMELPPDAALPLLKKVPMQKVTVAKEVVRLLGELRSEAAYAALLALDSPTLHRDIRIALLRALWDHLEREPTWQLFLQAALGADWVLASRVGDIPPDRLTPDVDRKLSQVLALVLDRKEPEARLDLLRRAAQLPIRDRERTFLAACVARMDSRFMDEVQAALQATLARAGEGDVAAVTQALARLRGNRRALSTLSADLMAKLPAQTVVTTAIAEGLVQVLADDAQATPLYLRLALAVAAQSWQSARLVSLLRGVQRSGLLHAQALAAAQDALSALPIARLPIDALETSVAELTTCPEAELRFLGVALLSTLAAPENGQGWTPARRDRLQQATQDPSPLVASYAQFIFPPAEEQGTAAAAPAR